MLKLEWNALRVGDRVLVHDPRDGELTLIDGVVLLLDTRKSNREANGVGIGVAAADGREVLWPPYLAVHEGSDERVEDCWRCDALAKTAAPLL